MKLAFITATPLHTHSGSGTYVGLKNLTATLRGFGHTIDLVTPRHTTSQFLGYTFSRIVWNLGLRARAFTHYDAVIGVDMDGFHIARSIGPPFLAYVNGVIADEASFERGITKNFSAFRADAKPGARNAPHTC